MCYHANDIVLQILTDITCCKSVQTSLEYIQLAMQARLVIPVIHSYMHSYIQLAIDSYLYIYSYTSENTDEPFTYGKTGPFKTTTPNRSCSGRPLTAKNSLDGLADHLRWETITSHDNSNHLQWRQEDNLFLFGYKIRISYGHKLSVLIQIRNKLIGERNKLFIQV